MKRRDIYLIVAVVLTLVSYFFGKPDIQPNSIDTAKIVIKPTPLVLSATESASIFKVKRVIDGDTIEIDNGQKIRYIGIDTPETVSPGKEIDCFAREASDKNKELVLGREVRLEKDVSDTDRYGRLLRYVYTKGPDLPEGIEWILVNDLLVREGYAQASTYPPDVKYQNLFLESQRYAKENGLGLWSECL